ncbi:MAG: SGNH/GDSL hydrolase family protein [Opitutia bacterium]
MKTLPFGLLLAFTSLALAAEPAPAKPAETVKVAPKAKTKAPDPAMTPIKDVAGLPRILLIGDSISIGYTLPVRKLLEGKANVHRIPTNGGPTPNGVANLGTWLGKDKWDVIHFNFGLHDLKIMPGGKRQVEPADYEGNLRALVTELRKTGAKLVFATTTPVPEGKLATPRNSADVAVYNQIALKVMNEHGVAIDDLNAAITPHLAKLQRPHDVHYTAEGSEALGQAVVKSLEKALGK